MSAAAMIAKTPHPTEDDVNRCLAGNLCRCGMYPRIKKAIARATGARATNDIVEIGGGK
jgi:isoquinoline 1-oxidoreductase alpha subunit